MQRVSARTLVLMLELLAAIVALQYIVAAKSPRAGAVWLDRGRSVVPPAAEVADRTMNT
jgi:hypothetical protein